MALSVTSFPIKFLFGIQTGTHWKVTSNICRKRCASFFPTNPYFPDGARIRIFRICDRGCFFVGSVR